MISKMGNLEDSTIGPGNEDAVFFPAEDIGAPSKLDALRCLEKERNEILLQIKNVGDDRERQELVTTVADVDLLMAEIEKSADLALLKKKLEGDIRSLEGALSEIEGIGVKSYVGALLKIKSERVAQKGILERRLALLNMVAGV